MRTLQLHIISQCSLRCDYCISNMNKVDWIHKDGLIDVIGVDKYLEHIDRLFDRYYPLIISMVAEGEPTDASYFSQVCDHFIDRDCNIEILTNMEHYDRILQVKNPKKITRITASFHMDSYLRHGRVPKDMVDRYRKVHDSGAIIDAVITPLSPLVLKHIDEYLEIAEQIKPFTTGSFAMYPTIMFHTYHGKEYPKSYTDEEAEAVKAIIYKFNPGRKVQLELMNQDSGGDDNIKTLTNTRNKKGKMCTAFDKFAAILINGNLWHCQSEPQIILGRLDTFSGEVFTPDAPCSVDSCLCGSMADEYIVK